MRSTWLRILLAAILFAAFSADAFVARISVRPEAGGGVRATLSGIIGACEFGFVDPPYVLVEPPRILVVQTTLAMGCPMTILPLPSRVVTISVTVPPLADGDYFVHWVDGFGTSPVGDRFDFLRSFRVEQGRVIVPVGDLTLGFYRGFLGREPDSSGQDFWADNVEDFVERGFDDLDIARLLGKTFVSSGELRASGLSDSEYVQRLYAGFLGRPADPGGLAYWTALLLSGAARDWVAAIFLHSAEFADRVARLDDPSRPTRPEAQLIGDVFRGALARTPMDEEYASWGKNLRAAQCPLYDFGKVRLAADAFVNLYFGMIGDTTNDEYVVALYDALLRRAADAGGLDYWSTQLDAGSATRDQVRAAFLQSGEFQVRVEAIARAGCVAPPP
jgi:hypothetical protein